MEFELTSELTNEIVFSMENQNELFVLDSAERVLRKKSDVSDSDPDRYYLLPVWDSLSGFRLMEHFVLSLRNPLAQEKLRAVLRSGHGVFRNFKNVLKEQPEIEKLWFSFKEREMNQVILEWYNSLREIWGLERLGAEPEDFEDVVFGDFSFREAAAADEGAVCALRAAADEELREKCGGELGGFISALAGQQLLLADSRQKLELVCETVSGDFAGFVSAFPCAQTGGKLFVFNSLFVAPRYRGLGLGKGLLQQSLQRLCALGAKYAVFATNAMGDALKQSLCRQGFKPLGSILYLELH